MVYKLIALDIDGTLITDDYRILALTKQTIQAAARSGCRIVLCTGRGPDSALPVLQELGLQGTLITHNGALTIDGATRRTLSRFVFGIDQIKPLIAYCRERSIHFDANTETAVYVESITDVGRAMYRQFYVEPIELSPIERVVDPLVKFTFFGEEQLLADVESFKQLCPSELNMIRSGDFFVDVMHGQASKGAALAELSRQWAIAPAEIIAFGNYYNDLEMLEFAGHGVAMANSPDEVKACADEVTLSNNEDGVHAVLVKYFL